jgi:hypothetical protein
VAVGPLGGGPFAESDDMGLEVAAQVLNNTQSMQETSEILRSMMLEGSHDEQNMAMTAEHGNCSVFGMVRRGDYARLILPVA